MNQAVVQRVLCFDRFSLDLTRGCLRAGGQDVELRPKTFGVLRYLVNNAGRLVAKEELYDAIWPNVIVSDESLTQCIRELRNKLGDDDHRLIKTVLRRGYLLDAKVSPETPQRPADKRTEILPEAGRAQLGLRQHVGTVLSYQVAAWAAVLAVVLGAAWWATSLSGLPGPLANPKHFTLVKNTPGTRQPLSSFKPCDDCPEMVALPAGEFMMGSPANERGRLDVEGLPRRVVISKRIAIGKFEVTLDQFSAFVAETGLTAGNLCRTMLMLQLPSRAWGPREVSFRQPGFDITGSHPVVCISWHEARSYVGWLRRRTGKPYRLPTEAEWEYAARAGTSTTYSFGNDESKLCAYARFADLDSRFFWADACRSGIPSHGTVPVGGFKPNPWGLFDMHGNAWEWVEDCWTTNALEIPTNGSAFLRPAGCELGVTRGGGFTAQSGRARSAVRLPIMIAAHHYNLGLRVALSLDE
jgi:formylglycine-generating enzyme required for sulfatase activity